MKSAKHQMKPSQQSNLEEPMHRSDRRMTNDPSQKAPVFIHSLFRAGSTYLFQVFRRCPEAFWCYQEPLHELVFLQKDNVHGLEQDHSDAKIRLLRHPRLEKTYFSELIQVWPAWKDAIDEEMIYGAYFDGAHTRMDFWRVLSGAAQTRPVFQECRTAGRIGALKIGLGGYHIYLWRNPWDQWWSFKVASYFDVAIQMMIRGRSAPAAVAHLLSHLKLPAYSGKDLGGAFSYYAQRPLNSSHSYLIFYLLWCLALREGLESADLMLNIDRLSDSPPYRLEILKKMEDVSIRGIHFDDCAIPQSFYSEKEKAFFGPLEEQVHGWLLAGGWSQKALDQLLEQRRRFQPECWVTHMNRSDSRQFAEQTDRARELAKRLESELAAHANHEADLQLALSLSENRITQLETNVKAKELEAEAVRLLREEFEAVRVDAAKTAGELARLAGKVEADAEQSAEGRQAFLATLGGLRLELGQVRKEGEAVQTSIGGLKEELAQQRKAQQEVVEKSVGGPKEELAQQRKAQQEVVEKSVGGLKEELAKQRKAQQEAVERSVGEVKKEIVAEIHSLIANLVEQGEKNRLEVSARIDSVKDRMEGRIAEMDALRSSLEDRLGKNESHLMDLAKYAEQIQDSVVAPSSYLIPAPFSWYSCLYKMLKIKKPVILNKNKTSGEAPKRPGFLRRLERSIRKRRKMLAAAWNFDPVWYLETYPEVSAAGVEPLSHYINFGKQEGRQKNKSHKRIGGALIRMVKALRKSSLTTAPQIFLEQLEGAFWVVTLKQTGKPLEGLAKFSARNRHDEFRLGEKLKNKTNIKVLLRVPLGIQKISVIFEDIYNVQKTVVTKIVNISIEKKSQPEKIVSQKYDTFVDLSAKQATATVWRRLEKKLRNIRKAIFPNLLLTIQQQALRESGDIPAVALTLNQQANDIFQEIRMIHK